jgi:hypothetical protein
MAMPIVNRKSAMAESGSSAAAFQGLQTGSALAISSIMKIREEEETVAAN